MEIRWDPQKAEANFRKHRIRFSEERKHYEKGIRF